MPAGRGERTANRANQANEALLRKSLQHRQKMSSHSLYNDWRMVTHAVAGGSFRLLMFIMGTYLPVGTNKNNKNTLPSINSLGEYAVEANAMPFKQA